MHSTERKEATLFVIDALRDEVKKVAWHYTQFMCFNLKEESIFTI